MNMPPITDDFERLSAFMDGELPPNEAQAWLKSDAVAQGQMSWQAYHVIGDVLRHGHLASPVRNAACLEYVRQHIQQERQQHAKPHEPLKTRPAAAGLDEAANDSAYLWRLGAGVAGLCMVGMLGWSFLGHQVQGQLARALPATAPPYLAVAVPAAGVPAAMLRDPQLDALLQAHRQNVAPAALGVPAGFLRSVAAQNGAP